MMEFRQEDVLEEVAAAVAEERAAEMRHSGAKIDELFDSIDFDLKDLTPRAGELLSKMAEYKKITNLEDLNATSLLCWYAEKRLEEMEYEPLILRLEQGIKNIEMDIEADRKRLNKFNEDLETIKKKLETETLDDLDRERCNLENKLSIYEDKLSVVNGKLARCNMPLEILPKSIGNLEAEIQSVKSKRDELKVLHDNVALARSAKKDLLSLRNKTLLQ